ncbi:MULTISPECIES: oxidoreductase [unclassified Janthinobacterium]|uniref:oxidoreductase n=1 Tax=unclassified Janthinobacterium TaxID=2610881 RepID=UPI00161CEB3F|nr:MULTISPECIES: oxidoreductase [unclassified Janthinobacterium]MBB5368664.1 NAD(P)-dependent dehydrogenase (short-subunit alcohol dehydrogenase family) [Janthinobacterium sp. K2C7]MBB5381800.1 NAD(P)-dependent dehydrogenase (short-subunit alcohol dehydrogenase family) [Janthinobacterium sp. K2Li3]MBB5387046.1 NAD(P)-dependent dehydrogenase (short-subunit alcohol dehydrogenase family) [Janthinobacterium sp. K2E3]
MQAQDKGSDSKVWMVTGASRGLGAEIVAAALAAGDRVVATARLAADVTQRFGQQPGLLALALDVTDEAAAHVAAAQAVAQFGRIDVLVNNAGYGIAGAVEEVSGTEARAVFNTNVLGLLNVSRAVLPQLRRQRSGHVINVSSLGGYSAGMGFGVYGATKFAVEGLSESLHAELAPLGIKVTVIEPGYFRTTFGASLQQAASKLADYAGTAGVVREVVRAAVRAPSQPGDPRKLADAVLQLVNLPQPPLRLQLGSDALQRVRAKHAFVEEEMARWEALSRSTDF